MAYFPNGTAAMMYEDRYCCRCKNQRDFGDGRGHGCAIWDAHLLYDYQTAGAGKEANEGRLILDLLIPKDDAGFPVQCAMFFEKSEEELETDRLIRESIHERGSSPDVMPCMAEWAKARGIIS